MDDLQPGDPSHVGPYRLVRRLNGGGMGQVYLGETPGGRKVAVKLILPALAQDAQFRERFAREIEAARRVGGFHTAMVVDADPYADPAWMVTAYIDGPSLQEKVRAGGPLRPERVRELGAALAEGLAAIHACGLVHRDLKPGNVIMADDGPRIIDFGIVRADDQMRLTTANRVFGTVPYMSPEQLAGDIVGPASDVFSLGSVLTFAATSRPPFGDGPGPAVMFRIAAEPPDLAGVAERPLRRLIADCLAKSPRDRPTLSAILSALARPGLPPAILDSPAMTLVSPEVSKIAFSPDGRLLAGIGMDGTVRLWDPATGQHRHFLTSDEGFAMAFSPDGRLLATGGTNGTVQLWDPASGENRGFLTERYGIFTDIAFSPDGRLLAAGGTNGTVRLWDPTSGEHWRTLASRTRVLRPFRGEEGYRVDAHVEVVAFSPDGRLLAAGYDDGTVWLWDPASGEHRHTLTGGKYPIYSMAFSPDGRLLAVDSGAVGLWDPSSRQHQRTVGVHKYAADVAFSPDGRLLATGSTDGTLRLWDPASGQRRCAVTTGRVHSVAFSPDGRLLATAETTDTSHAVRLWPVNRPADNQDSRRDLGRPSQLLRDGRSVLAEGRRCCVSPHLRNATPACPPILRCALIGPTQETTSRPTPVQTAYESPRVRRDVRTGE